MEPLTDKQTALHDARVHFTMLAPFEIDLIGDYAGSEFFVIDGDSLLRKVFDNASIDVSRGLQLLHAVWELESFLEKLRRRRCAFAVVFLEDAWRTCLPPSAVIAGVDWKLRFARRAIIQHLELIDPSERLVKVFASFSDPEFRSYLKATKPYFAVCHDGGRIPEELDEDELDMTEVEAEAWSEQVRCELLVKARLLEWSELGFNIATVNSFTFNNSRVFATIVESKHHFDTGLEEGVVEAPVRREDKSVQLHSGLSAREALVAEAVGKYFKDGAQQTEEVLHLASVYLLHAVLLPNLSLAERQIVQLEAVPENVDTFLKAVLEIEEGLLTEFHYAAPGDKNDIADAVDGRLFHKLLQEGLDALPSRLTDDLQPIRSRFGAVNDITEEICSVSIPFPTLPEASGKLDTPEDTDVSDIGGSERGGVKGFNHPVFEPYLDQIKLSVDVDFADHTDNSDNIFREEYHWHNAKKRLNPRPNTQTTPNPNIVQGGKSGKGQQKLTIQEKRARGKVRKWEQIYLNQMTRYAASLTDSADGSLNPKLVIVDKKGVNAPKEPEASSSKPVVSKKPVKEAKPVKEKPVKEGAKNKKAPAKPGKNNPAKMSAAEIRAQNTASKGAAKASALQTSWLTITRALVKADDEKAIRELDFWFKKTRENVAKDPIENPDWPIIEVEARFYKLFLLQRIWARFCKKGQREQGYGVAAMLFSEACSAYTSPGLTRKACGTLQTLFKEFGISMPPGVDAKKLPDKPLGASLGAKWDGTVAKLDTSIGMSSEEFQLLHCGPYMVRGFDSAPDPRVSFHPDAWQRKVLDELDGNNSMLVVAPTSAGKTFVAFYAMEKILRGSDDDVLVYIAPTKALVNQIAAEVLSRFKKNYTEGGKSTYAIFTRDYRQGDPLKCQILITVPEIFQIMLMSPNNAAKWAPRVKRIVFDEVHSINAAEQGIVWEQLLLIAPCPIIALSATIGNPQEFSDWLKDTQSVVGTKLSLILHPHRYSDLRKAIYAPPADAAAPFKALSKASDFADLDLADPIADIHPVSSLTLSSPGIPDGLALESRDCLTLYRAMAKVQTEDFPVPADMDFKKIFGTSGNIIIKKAVTNWETSLKALLQSWIEDANSPFADVLKELRNKPAKAIAPVKAGEEIENAIVRLEGNEVDYLKQTTLPMLRTLHDSNAIPALVFSYDRHLCEILAKEVCDQLSAAEEAWRKTDPVYGNRFKAWKDYQKTKSNSKPRPMKKETGSTQTKADLEREAAESEGNMLEQFDPEFPSPEFSFANNKKFGKQELEQELKRLIGWDIPVDLVNAFKRGVGVHHAGLNRKYRQSVEMLFRKGFLQVVFATGTLALGINMPTKTTVFAGDTVYLTALNYHQASGRAGRRGFDNLGHVVFHGMPREKINRLISSKLPSLLGHFPINTALVLRLFILLHNSGQAEFAVRTVESLLTRSRLVLGSDGEQYKKQILHNLRLSIEFLRKQRLISAAGEPLNFAGLVSHLYYTDDRTFAFHSLLLSGDIQRICEGFTEKPEETCLELMLILANLFGNKKAHGNCRLPPMPAHLVNVLRKKDEETLKLYTSYIRAFVKEYCADDEDNVLPFSHARCGADGKRDAAARSSFVALSGHTDAFNSVPDLVSSLRSSVFLDGAEIPALTPPAVAPNSYLYEFYKHGNVILLARDNGITASEVWFLLKDFSLILGTIVAGLTSFLRDGPGAYFEFEREEEDDGFYANAEEEEVELDEEEQEEVRREKKGWVDTYRAFCELRREFDRKFKAMWA